MATINQKTFPGVYTQIIDRSFIPTSTSRFKPGLIGVASKGPFDAPTVITSLKDFVLLFGNPITTEYNNEGRPTTSGYFLADAVAMIGDMTDAITVVRVGNRYADMDTSNGSGSQGSYVLGTDATQAQQIADFLARPAPQPSDVYIRVSQAGLPSTVNALVESAGPTGVANSGTVILSPFGDPLAAEYDGATISYSQFDGAANNAEGFLYTYTYGTDSSSVVDEAVLSGISGQKNTYQFYAAGATPTNTPAGSVYKIVQNTKNTTHEVRVKQVMSSGTVMLETTDVTRVGYQALPLADNYTNAYLYKATGKQKLFQLQAATAGEWANGTKASDGLFVQVRPGSLPGTKKMEIYWDGGLVETFDNLSDDPDSTDYYLTRINGLSQFITITLELLEGFHPANTAKPWDTYYYGSHAAPTDYPISMPGGAVNAGLLTIDNVATDTGGQFTSGYNGQNAQDEDFIGQVDTVNETMTGIKSLEETDNVDVNVICAPMDQISIGIEQQLRDTAKKTNAVAIVDVWSGLSARQAIDWHNGTGMFEGRGKIDDYSIAVYWNWLYITDKFTGQTKLVPPTLGVLRCLAFTFERDKPWYAAAGETRGYIPEAVDVEFERVSADTKQAMYGNGQSVNPILKMRGRHVLYGERTMQRLESKLTAVHSVILVNWIVKGMAELARLYVFDPNDQELLTQLRLAFTEYLDKIKNERGLEVYQLIVDDSNNTADTRNRREVIVDLSIVPTDTAERIYINATVRESGAILNSVTS